jgi:hypothetical protein
MYTTEVDHHVRRLGCAEEPLKHLDYTSVGKFFRPGWSFQNTWYVFRIANSQQATVCASSASTSGPQAGADADNLYGSLSVASMLFRSRKGQCDKMPSTMRNSHASRELLGLACLAKGHTRRLADVMPLGISRHLGIKSVFNIEHLKPIA